MRWTLGLGDPGDSGGWGRGGVGSRLAPSPVFLFNIRKAEQTWDFSVEPVKLVLSHLGLFSSVLFAKLVI